MQRSVTVEIKPDGVTKVEAHGFQGASCTLATRELELVLAGNPGNVEDRRKPDFYATNGQTNHLSNGR